MGVTPSLDSSERGKHHTLESWPGVAEENILNMNAIIYGLVHGNLVSQKIFYIHRQSTICILSSSVQQRVPMEYYYVRKWNVCTSRYLDVVATFIVVISDLDSRFSGIDFQIFDCVASLIS